MKNTVTKIAVMSSLLIGATAAHAEKYYVDDFAIQVGGITTYDDQFNDGVPPPSGPGGPFDYSSVFGNFHPGSESGGKLELDPANYGGLNGVGAFQFKQLSAVGFNSFSTTSAFSITSVFDLIAPAPKEAYTMFYGEFGFDTFGSLFIYDVLLGIDTLTDGTPVVHFHAFDEVGLTEEVNLTQSVDFSGHSQIAFTLDHQQGTDALTASYQYMDGGVSVGSMMSFANPYTLKPGALAGFSGLVSLAPLPAPVPEPETYVLMLVGLGLLGFARRRAKAAAQLL